MATTPPQIDARVVIDTALEGTGLKTRDYALLALLNINDGASISHLNRIHLLVYIAQVGGLYDHRRETSEYDAISTYFPTGQCIDEATFAAHSRHLVVGPTEIEQSLIKLVDTDLVTAIEHPSTVGEGREEYSISDFGEEILSQIEKPLPDSEMRTLKLVKTIYNEVALHELIDIVEEDYELRKCNDLL